MSEAPRKAKAALYDVIRLLASLKLAVCLIVILAVVIAFATILEVKHGRPYSQWFVYHSSWFIGLLGLLGVSVFSAAYVRYPWKRHQTGFVITHAGLLVLLTGSIVTYFHGFEGQVVLREGTSTNQLTFMDRSQITAYWSDRPHDRPYVFTFDSGPVDWQPATELNIGSVDGLSARVLRYYHHAERFENWVVDSAGHGGPMVRFQLDGAHGGGHVEHFLVDADYGSEMFVGPIAIRLQRAFSDAMIADFLMPPEAELGEKGLLTVYYDDQVKHVSVDKNLGQEVALGGNGPTVELVQHLTNAKLDATGRFQAIGEDLRNPLVELKVKAPGIPEPFRQVAYAKSPLLNFDGVYERDCPVKFVYRHPKIAPTTAIEFVRSDDGKLFGRTIEAGNIKSQGEQKAGDKILLPGGFTFTIAEYLPHARREILFRQAKEVSNEKMMIDLPAAKVEIAAAGTTKTLWMQRNHPEFASGTVDLPEGVLRAHFTTAQTPLGFSIELVDFKREGNPGRSGNASYSSVIRITDPDRKLDDKRVISMNRPLSHRGLRFYQTSFREDGHGKEASILSVAYDPGRFLKYLGSLMLCIGIATMFYMKAYFFKKHATVEAASSHDTNAPIHGHALKVA